MNNKGFSLVEVLLSVALFALMALGLTSSLAVGTQTIQTNGKRSRAVQIAEQGLSAVRSIRDSDFASLIDGTYGIGESVGAWSFSGSSDTVDIFTRTVNVSTISSNEKLIEATITWPQTLQRTGSYTASTVLTDWRAAQPVNDVLRATEYYVDGTNVTGLDHPITLDQPLQPHYFVIIQGAEGDDITTGTYGPNSTYSALSADPFGTGDLASSGAPNQIRIRRGGLGTNALWKGVITVVECLTDCKNNGFELLDVNEVAHSGSATTGADTSAAWTDINKVMLMGGFNGSGCHTNASSSSQFPSCHARIFPSGSNVINWQRGTAGVSLATATSTVMSVQWGNAWNVQRRSVSGSNGGDGADAINEYNTASINPVVRANTWVWGTGYVNNDGIGDGAEASLITLGNGVTLSPVESLVAVGQEYLDFRNFEVYALTHPQLAVSYFFKPDGHGGNLVFESPTTSAPNPQKRFSIITNGSNGTGLAFPRPVWSSRYTANTQIRLERRRIGQDWPAWVHGINVAGINVSIDSTAPAQITTLSAGSPTTSSVGLNWLAPGDDGNTGTATSYDIRYSTSPINDLTWGLATPVAGEPVPLVAGSSQSMTISGLNAGTQYYFAMRTTDESGNVSITSNSPSATTQIIVATMADSLLLNTNSSTLCCGNRRWVGWTLSNTSASVITIDKIKVSWNVGSSSLNSIELNSNVVYSGTSANGSTTDINDTSITGLGVVANNELRFNGSMIPRGLLGLGTSSILSVTFIMTDGSTRTFSGIAL